MWRDLWVFSLSVFCLFIFNLENGQALKEESSKYVKCPSMEVLELDWTRACESITNSDCAGWRVKIPPNLNCPVIL